MRRGGLLPAHVFLGAPDQHELAKAMERGAQEGKAMSLSWVARAGEGCPLVLHATGTWRGIAEMGHEERAGVLVRPPHSADRGNASLFPNGGPMTVYDHARI
jgi:hypothetical protein